MNMEFFHSFVPVFIKYNFTSEENYRSNVAKVSSARKMKCSQSYARTKMIIIFACFTLQDWIECRLNVKPAPGSYQCVQITVYPKCYDEMMPHFSVDIDYSSIRCGPVQSRSRENVFGMVWGCKRNKKSRIFIAFDSKIQLQNFSKYFRKLLKFFNNDCENGK